MKKILSIILTLTLVLALGACGEKRSDVAGNDSSAVETSTTADWKTFLKDYEEWVDKYVELTKKYNENPGDISIVGDYTAMLSELAEWATKADELTKELESASATELAEYNAELARILSKLPQ